MIKLPVEKLSVFPMFTLPLMNREPVIVWSPLNKFEPVIANEPVFIVVEELINPNAVICADEDIVPFKLVKNEPVSLSVIQLPLTFSIAFNLLTNDDVDCDAVNVFKFEIDVTKLAVETDAVKVFKLLIEVTIDAVVTLAVNVFKFEIDVTKLAVEILAV